LGDTGFQNKFHHSTRSVLEKKGKKELVENFGGEKKKSFLIETKTMTAAGKWM